MEAPQRIGNETHGALRKLAATDGTRKALTANVITEAYGKRGLRSKAPDKSEMTSSCDREAERRQSDGTAASRSAPTVMTAPTMMAAPPVVSGPTAVNSPAVSVPATAAPTAVDVPLVTTAGSSS